MVACCLALALVPLFAGAAEKTGAPDMTQEAGHDEWERFPAQWAKAAKTTGDDALFLLTSPLRLTLPETLAVGAIGAGIGGLFLADREIRGAVRAGRGDSLRDAASAVGQLGSAPVLLGLNLGAIAVGEGVRQATGSSRLLDVALVSAEAQLLTLALSEGLAYATARSRPEDSDDPFRFRFGRDSFPSSHASQAFAVAAVLADRYEQPVGAIAYGLAGLVALSRLVEDKHWASDVAAGAVLGWAVGRALSRRHAGPHPYLDFFPFADPATKTYGFLIHGEF